MYKLRSSGNKPNSRGHVIQNVSYTARTIRMDKINMMVSMNVPDPESRVDNDIRCCYSHILPSHMIKNSDGSILVKYGARCRGVKTVEDVSPPSTPNVHTRSLFCTVLSYI